MNTSPLLLQEVTKRFRNVTAVDSISFSLEKGEVLGVVGANGAGKSTTMRMIVDLIRPTAGVIRVFGQSPQNALVREKIGYLPGEVHTMKGIRGRSLLSYYEKLSGYRSQEISHNIDTYAELLDIDLSRQAATLSKGNRQKIGLIQAFAHRPDLLILDEPTSGLDSLTRHTFITMVKEATSRGTAVFLSSHVLSEIHACADRIAIMSEGKIREICPVGELLARAGIVVDAIVSKDMTSWAHSCGLAVTPLKEDDIAARGIRLMTDAPLDSFVHLTGVLPSQQNEEVLRGLAHSHKILHVTITRQDLEELVLTLYPQRVKEDNEN